MRGIVDGELHRYHHLGDGSTQTDNKIYDPSLAPWQVEGDRSGTPDDRWVYTDATPFSNYMGIGALAAASRSLRGYNDALAEECLALARKAYAEEKARPAAPAPQGPFGGFGQAAELTAVMQLMAATKEKAFADRFDELVWPALDRNAAMTIGLAARAIPEKDAAYAAKLAVRREVPGGGRRPAEAEPVRRADRHCGWAGNSQAAPVGHDELPPEQGLPRPLRPGPRDPRPRLPLRHAPGAQLLVRVRGREPPQAPGLRKQPGGLLVHRGRHRPRRPRAQAGLPENMDDWPFLWGENEYVIDLGASYIFLANAAQEMLAR
ncbi:MAG: hypothetical protein U0599_16770 [Vicinamibacteria bacterium]